MIYQADLHIHSCLSPCASLDMSPLAIVRQAKAKGLNAIALTDHNCALNCPAFAEACAQEGISCLFGIEVTTSEEAHVLCLFDTLDTVMDFGAYIYDHLPPIQNHPETFGDQPVVNLKEEIKQLIPIYLNSPTDISLTTLLIDVHERDGLFIPAHIDRPVMSIPSQLGFLPKGEAYDAVEITRNTTDEDLEATACGYPILTSSDAHFLNDIGSAYTIIEAYNLSIPSLKTFFQTN